MRGKVWPAPRRAEQMGLPLRWEGESPVLYVPPTPGLDHERLVEVVRAAAARWESPCSGLKVVVKPTFRPIEPAQDGVSTLVFQQAHWCRDAKSHRSDCFDDKLDGHTELYSKPLPPSQERAITEADIRINVTNKSAGSDEVQAIITHEIGHFLGLDHPCSGITLSGAKPACEHEDPAIMHPDPLRKGRSLTLAPHANELEALCAIYPRSGVLGPTPHGVWVVLTGICVALFFLFWLRARKRYLGRTSSPS